MKRESFIFYKSFYESIKELDPLDQVQIYDAIFKHQFMGEDVELKGICKSIFTLIIPQLEANNKRYLNGLKGGAPKGNRNATKKQSKNNLELTKKQPNENVNENVNVNDNENVNVKEKDKKEKYGEFNNVMLTKEEYKKLEEKNALSQIENLSRYLASTGKRYKSHYATILNWDRRDKQQQEEDKYKGMSYREREYLRGQEILEQWVKEGD
jgi:hypothetical protein